MFIFPALITPTIALSLFTPFILLPVVIIAFIIWQIKKLNRIEEKLTDIQEKLKGK